MRAGSTLRAGQGAHTLRTSGFLGYWHQLPHRTLHAFVTVVRAVPLEKYGPWDSHDSEDFLHVLEGTIVVHMEGREPIELKPGDSLQMDGRIKHALVSRKGLASLLWVSVPFV
jgi:quercetin dioxygenase-like cupin family protein